MSEHETTAGEQGSPQQEQEELRREIERTRAELGETVEALSHKADVKAQAREKVEHAKAQAQQAKAQAMERVEHAKSQAGEGAQNMQSQARERPAVPLAVGIGVAIVALWLIRRRRRS